MRPGSHYMCTFFQVHLSVQIDSLGYVHTEFLVRGFCIHSASNSVQITAVFSLPFFWMEILRVSIDPADFLHMFLETAPHVMSILGAVSASKIYMTAAALIKGAKPRWKARQNTWHFYSKDAVLLWIFSTENACNLIWNFLPHATVVCTYPYSFIAVGAVLFWYRAPDLHRHSFMIKFCLPVATTRGSSLHMIYTLITIIH